MKTPILGAAYTAKSLNAASDRCINLFPEAIQSGGKEAASLLRCPGLRKVATIGNGPIFGMYRMGEELLVVSGGELYSCDPGYNATLVGNTFANSPVSMADNGYQVFIACSPGGFIYNTTAKTLRSISDPDFPGSIDVAYLDGYFPFIEPDSQKIWVTAVLDGTSIDALEYASAEGASDKLIGMACIHRELWLFGETTSEVWYNTGETDYPLARMQGAFLETGCAAKNSIAKADNSVFWVGADDRGRGIVYRSEGYSVRRISTHHIEYELAAVEDLTLVTGFTSANLKPSFQPAAIPSFIICANGTG